MIFKLKPALKRVFYIMGLLCLQGIISITVNACDEVINAPLQSTKASTSDGACLSCSNQQASPENVQSNQVTKAQTFVACNHLLTQLEHELLKTPNDQALQILFEKTLQKCSTPSDSDMAENALAQQKQWKLNSSLQFVGGYDSNPLNTASVSEFNFTLNNQMLVLPNPNQANPSHYHTLRYQLNANNQEDLRFDLSVQKQRYQSSELDSQQFVRTSVWWFQPKQAWLASFSDNQYQNSTYQQYSLSYRRLLPAKIISNVELGYRDFEQNDIFDSSYLALDFSQPLVEKEFQTWQYRYSIGAMLDKPVRDRAGGNQYRLSASQQLQYPLQQHLLTAYQSISYTQDSQGYSELVENGAKRKVTFIHSQLSWQYPWQKQVSVYLKAQWQWQFSNIALFESRKRVWEIGLEVNW